MLAAVLWLLSSLLFAGRTVLGAALVAVNTSNSHSFLSNPTFLLEFYAPWCGHCTQFAPQYKNIATVLSGSPHGFAVGSCDSSANPALSARFDVQSIPTLFLFIDSKTYRYEGALLRDPIIDWATSSYKTKQPLSFITSPMGAMGQSKGALIRIGDVVMQALPGLTERLGLPRWAGFAIVAAALGVGILFAILMVVFLSVKMKVD